MNATPEPITISFEHAQRLFDLATDSPLICSGSFETDDVRVLRHLAALIGVDPAKATPDEFVRDFPHPFARRQVRAEPIPTGDWVKNGRILAEHEFGAQWRGRMETVEEQRARMAEERTDETCQAGPYSRRCGRPEGDPMHAAADHHARPAEVDTGGCPPPDGCPPNFCVGADDCRREYDEHGDDVDRPAGETEG